MTKRNVVVLVTGATDGIGKATARRLADEGAVVVVHGRTRTRAESVARELSASTGRDAFVPCHGDFASLGAVRSMAERLHKLSPSIDVLISNAGICQPQLAWSLDGYELTFAVNHLAPFLLIHLLLPLLEATPKGRIVLVSSSAHRRGHIDLDALPRPAPTAPFDGRVAYDNSKLANLLLGDELVRRLGSHPRVYSAHPGTITTKLLVEGFGRQGRDDVLDAASALTRLATDDDVAADSGSYFVLDRRDQASVDAHAQRTAPRLYELCAKWTGILPLAPMHEQAVGA